MNPLKKAVITAGIIINISYSTGKPVDGILVNGQPVQTVEIPADSETVMIEIVPPFSSYQIPEPASLADVIRQLQILTGAMEE